MKNDRITVILFALLLALPFPAYLIFGKMLDSQSHEQRTLAEFPTLTVDTVEQFPSDFDHYLNDHLPFKNQMTSVNSLLDMKLFNRSSSGKVVFGKEGWLFYSDVSDGNCLATYKGIDLFSANELELIARNLTTAQAALREKGIDFYLFIAPDKQQIYPEYMPDYITVASEQKRTDLLVSYLRENTDINVVYVKDALICAKQEGTLFYQLDTHWNDLGAYIGAKELLGAMGCNLNSYTAIEKNPPYYTGDLANVAMTGKSLAEKGKVTLLGDFGQYYCQSSQYEGVSRYFSKEESCLDLKIMVERDSFADSMIQYLCPAFSESVYSHRNNFSGKTVWEESPDIFVYQTVERYLYQLKNFTLQ